MFIIQLVPLLTGTGDPDVPVTGDDILLRFRIQPWWSGHRRPAFRFVWVPRSWRARARDDLPSRIGLQATGPVVVRN